MTETPKFFFFVLETASKPCGASASVFFFLFIRSYTSLALDSMQKCSTFLSSSLFWNIRRIRQLRNHIDNRKSFAVVDWQIFDACKCIRRALRSLLRYPFLLSSIYPSKLSYIFPAVGALLIFLAIVLASHLILIIRKLNNKRLY